MTRPVAPAGAPDAAPAGKPPVALPPGDPPVALPPGDPLYGSPTAVELLDAVEGFLRHGFGGADRALAYQARVAANVVAIVRRQLQAGAGPYERVAAALAALGADGEAALAAAVRSGRVDHRSPDLRAALEILVRTRLAVANPRHLGTIPESTDREEHRQ